MIGSYFIGGIMVVIGVILVGIALPDKAGQSPRFLRFEAALVLYPGLVMIFLALGAADVVVAFTG